MSLDWRRKWGAVQGKNRAQLREVTETPIGDKWKRWRCSRVGQVWLNVIPYYKKDSLLNILRTQSVFLGLIMKAIERNSIKPHVIWHTKFSLVFILYFPDFKIEIAGSCWLCPSALLADKNVLHYQLCNIHFSIVPQVLDYLLDSVKGIWLQITLGFA